MNQNAESNNYSMYAETIMHKDKRMQDKGKTESKNTKIYTGSLFLKSYVQYSLFSEFLCLRGKEHYKP